MWKKNVGKIRKSRKKSEKRYTKSEKVMIDVWNDTFYLFQACM
jgi:hypothetical protein